MSKVQLQFGCGGNRLEGWSNYDMEMDLEKLPLPFPDNHADKILLEHCGEHFPCDHLTKMLEEFRRILKPGGVLRVCFPVIGVHLKREHARDLLVGHGHKTALDRNLAITILWAAGFDLPNIEITGRDACDGHHHVIGKELDDLETIRINAKK